AWSVASTRSGRRPARSPTGTMPWSGSPSPRQASQLLVHNGRIKLLEDRLRRGELAPRLDRRGAPPRPDAAVAGQHRISWPPIQIVNLHKGRQRGVYALATEQLVDGLRGVRQERAEDGVQVGDRLQHHVQDGADPLLVLLQLPRRLLGEVLVDLGDRPH